MKRVHLFPNLITTANFLSGVISIIMSLNGNFVRAGDLILLAILFDILDGYIARLLKVSNRFGVEYDSLADLISFGLAPGVLLYVTALKGSNWGMVIVLLYTVTCALRLARYNVQLKDVEIKFFTGLPTPASAGALACLVLMVQSNPQYKVGQVPTMAIMAILSILMVSTVKYPSLKTVDIWRKKPFVYLVGLALLSSLVALHKTIVACLIFFVYLLSGIVFQSISFFQIRKEMHTSQTPIRINFRKQPGRQSTEKNPDTETKKPGDITEL